MVYILTGDWTETNNMRMNLSLLDTSVIFVIFTESMFNILQRKGFVEKQREIDFQSFKT